jgi:hypothetical protein
MIGRAAIATVVGPVMLVGVGVGFGGGTTAPDATPRWGFGGHEMAAQAAVRVLPDVMPEFFLEADDQLVWLGPEPDRWKDRDRPAMDQAWTYDHYIDFENVPEEALDAPDRFTFLAALYAEPADQRLERPERDAGFLLYRIVEVYERLVTAWSRWADAPAGSDERRWLEERIVNDAGILGHYVTDGSQPHHTTIHFNGWDADTPNPEGYTNDRSFHSRFERFFVDSHVSQQDLDRRMSAAPAPLQDTPREAVLRYLRRTFEEVPTLYRLDRDVGFDPDGRPNEATRDFAAERLTAGAEMLATLWWEAWVEGTR